VQENHRLAVRIAAFFIIEPVTVTNIEHSAPIGFDGWIQGSTGCTLNHGRIMKVRDWDCH
jgi:hypothetical protein